MRLHLGADVVADLETCVERWVWFVQQGLDRPAQPEVAPHHKGVTARALCSS